MAKQRLSGQLAIHIITCYHLQLTNGESIVSDFNSQDVFTLTIKGGKTVIVLYHSGPQCCYINLLIEILSGIFYIQEAKILIPHL